MNSLIDRRWNFRKLINTAVVLNTPGLGVIHAETRDVGYGGMRLDTTPLALPNSKVRVTFLMREDGATMRQSIDARVAYTNGRGCGLVFEEFHCDTFTFLHRLIHFDTQDAAPRREAKLADA